jgi:serine protease Do
LSLGNLDFSSNKYKDQGLVISNAKNVIVQADVKIDEAINSAAGSLVGIYKKQKPVKPDNIFRPENFYELNGAVGQGFIITSDGWLVTALSLAKTFNDYVVITGDKRILPIDKAAVDDLTGYSFIHVAARDLPVRKFADNQDIKKGGSVIGLNLSGLSWISSIAGFGRVDGLIRSSDNFSRTLILNKPEAGQVDNSVIFNLAGDVIGLINDQGLVRPISQFAGAINSLFKNKIVTRPSLGVNYVDLSELAAIDSQSSFKKGAVLYRDKKAPAVVKNSSADKAGLKEGDIIISLDNIELNKSNNLSDIILSHQAGDTVNLTVLSAGQEKEVKVILEK